MSDLDSTIKNIRNMMRYITQKIETASFELDTAVLDVLESRLSDALTHVMHFIADRNKK